MIKFARSTHHYFHSRWPTQTQFVRYAISGGIGAIIDFGLYIGLTRGFDYWQEHYLWANALSFVIANITTFFLHKYFSFNQRSGNITHQYARFVVVSLVYIGIIQVVLYVGVNVFLLHDILAKVIAQVFGLAWNFGANKFWSFKVKKAELEPNSEIASKLD